MSDGYGFTAALPALATTGWLLGLLLAGRWLERRTPATAVAIARLLPPVAVAGAAWLVDAEPAGTRMLVLVAALFAAMKLLVLAVARSQGTPRLTRSAWLLFVLAWPGMDPASFVRRAAGRRDGHLARRGLRNAGAGIAVVLAACLFPRAWLAPVLMLGASLAVHFGLFTLLCAWHRRAGRAVHLPFDAPHRARSLGEFWARRWNRGFAEMTALVVQRPLAARIGRRSALLLSFLVSGVLHEVAISLPVRAGYGLPTLYFLLQGALVAWLPARHGRLVALLAVVLPVPLVFHQPFVRGVVLPLLASRL